MSRSTLALALLVASAASAIAIVLTRHETRRLFVELQALQAGRDAMNDDWGRLQLEEATLGRHIRVETFARTKLGMTSPGSGSVVVYLE